MHSANLCQCPNVFFQKSDSFISMFTYKFFQIYVCHALLLDGMINEINIINGIYFC